jgi:hypothetical protein
MKKVTKKVIDLSTMDTVAGSNEGFDVQIFHPGTNEDLDIVINVLGKDSDEFLKTSRAQQKRRLGKIGKGGFRAAQSQVSPEEMEADGITLLAACTKSWRQGEKATLTLEGKELPCTKENAIMVYERFPWIKEQVDIAMGDRANFLKS